jgi:hypothetical protein
MAEEAADNLDQSPMAGLKAGPDKPTPNPELASWVMEKVNRWRTKRDSLYSSKWAQYYRIWRGVWDPSLKNKAAERSRIITPATQSAVDQTVAEMAEAVFGRGMWFDLSDEQDDDQSRQAEQQVRDNLIEDLANSRIIPDSIEVFYNGALYGTGIAKRVVEDKKDKSGQTVNWIAVKPEHFVIDTSAKIIDDALGCAHETVRPFHEIEEKKKSGEYYDVEISSASGYGPTNLLKGTMTDLLEIDPEDGVYLTEYHGLVPTRLLSKVQSEEETADADLLDDSEQGDDDESYTEAVVVIGNGGTLLKDEKNELEDRGFISYQHHRAPDSFHGIGVVEKAFNSQVGLDGEVRARMDALSLTTYPIVGVDATRMPKSLSMTVAPGKVYMTNGRPSEIIEPIVFGSLNNASFQQSGDMERYVQVATGATDPAKPINANSTASGQSQQSAAFIKRAKLTMQTLDADFLSPLIRKTIIAYSALDPQRYPRIPNFVVNSSMSIMAREFEQMQMTNLLAIIPQQSPAFPIILKGIIDNYSGPQKDKIIAAIEQSMKPDPAAQQYQQQMQQIQMGTAQAGMEKAQAERDEIKSRVPLNSAKAQHEQVKAKLAPAEVQIQAAQAQVADKHATVAARQVEVDAAGKQIDHHHKTQEHVHKKVANAIELAKTRTAARAQAAQEQQAACAAAQPAQPRSYLAQGNGP